MVERARELAAEVARWLEAAEAVDGEEDRQFGADKRGDELPAWVAGKQQRLSKIRAAKAALEAAAAAAAQDKAKAEAAAAARRRAEGRLKPGRKAKPPRRARRQGATELHRPREPRSSDPGRVQPRL